MIVYVIQMVLGCLFCWSVTWSVVLYIIQGVGNELKFCRSPLKIILKDEIWPETLIILLY